MDCYYISQIEKDYKDYLQDQADDQDQLYKWTFCRSCPKIIHNVNVKNICFSGNRELVVLKALMFFEENGGNFFHALLLLAIEHFQIETIDDFKKVKNQFFCFMTSISFTCQCPRLCEVETEEDEISLEEVEEVEEAEEGQGEEETEE